MKKLTLSLVFILSAIVLLAQTPQAFSYQAVVRDNAGAILQNQNVGVRISIHDVTAGGTIIYQETFYETTNQFGLVNLEIGKSTPAIGSFENINWSSDPKFIETEIDISGGTAYISMGASELLSVPYALYSGATGDTSMWRRNGDAIYYYNGMVGIGTTSPQGDLHVNSPSTKTETIFIGTGLNDLNVDYSAYCGSGTTNYVAELTNAGPDPNIFKWSNDNGSTWTENVEMAKSGINVGLCVIIGFDAVYGHTYGDQWSWSVSEDFMNELVVRNGKVGIGIATPGAELEVAGMVKITGGSPGDRKALFSDTSGLASWHYVAIDDLADGQTDTTSVFLGMGAGTNDDGDNYNTALGINALHLNTSRGGLVAIGNSALFYNGSYVTLPIHATGNTAIGSKALYSNTRGSYNTAIGGESLYANDLGYSNTAIGMLALSSNTYGYENTAVGSQSLFSNTSGIRNTGNGRMTLYNNTTGNSNTATGFYALYYNTTGTNNTATGYRALNFNTTGNSNVAIGNYSLLKNTDRSNLVAIGDSALFNNGVGVTNWRHATANTAVGSKALFSNVTGYDNTAKGYQALYSNTLGDGNTANGCQALQYNTSGDRNTAIGYQALYSNTTGGKNIGIGSYAGYFRVSDTYCTHVGYGGSFNTSSVLSNSMSLGALASINVSNIVRIGSAGIVSIGGYTGWTNLSDKRFKRNITKNVPGLEFILMLQPVTYNLDVDKIDIHLGIPDSIRYDENLRKGVLKKAAMVQTGFIAQDVEEAAQSLGFDFSGVDPPKNENDFYGLRYAEFVVPLVKAVQEQQAMIEQLQKDNELLRLRLEAVEEN